MTNTTHEARIHNIVLPQPRWFESGDNLPATQPQGDVQRPYARISAQTPTRRPKPVEIADFAPLVNRQLVNQMGNTMRVVKPLEVYGRIVLTRFIPSQACDPIMPVALIEFSGVGGWLHNSAYRAMAGLLIELEAPGAWNTRLFVKLAKRYARRIIRFSKPFMKPSEHQYYIHHMWECVANPHRRDWRQIAAQQNRSE